MTHDKDEPSLDELMLDPAGGLPDDGQERNWDGETREERLTAMQEGHDEGNVFMEYEVWRVREDAVDEVGAEEVARLRDRMESYLRREWAALDE